MGQQDIRIAKRLAIVIMIIKVIKEMKNHFHLALVVTRMSMMEMEILAVASAEGVIQNPIQRIFRAFAACFGSRNLVCLPRP